MTAVNITLNGKPQQVRDGQTVADLVAELIGGPAGIAVAVNAELVPRSLWGTRTLRGGDDVEALTAAPGG